MKAIEQTLGFLRAAAVAPVSEFSALARQADALPRIPLDEAGAVAAMLALRGREIVRQMQFACAAGQIALRDALCALVNAIEAEIEARGGLPVPYYEKG